MLMFWSVRQKLPSMCHFGRVIFFDCPFLHTNCSSFFLLAKCRILRSAFSAKNRLTSIPLSLSPFIFYFYMCTISSNFFFCSYPQANFSSRYRNISRVVKWPFYIRIQIALLHFWLNRKCSIYKWKVFRTNQLLCLIRFPVKKPASAFYSFETREWNSNTQEVFEYDAYAPLCALCFIAIVGLIWIVESK